MSFLTFLRLIAERYITSSQGRPQFSVGRPVDRVGKPWHTRPKHKTATGWLAGFSLHVAENQSISDSEK